MTETYTSSTGFYASPIARSSLDETWSTPRDRFDTWNNEFHFSLDAAALQVSALCDEWYGPDHPDQTRRDAFTRAWHSDAGGGRRMAQPALRQDDWRVDA